MYSLNALISELTSSLVECNLDLYIKNNAIANSATDIATSISIIIALSPYYADIAHSPYILILICRLKFLFPKEVETLIFFTLEYPEDRKL